MHIRRTKKWQTERQVTTVDKGSVPLHTYHIDHLSPLMLKRKQYQHILVVIDLFSKFTWLYTCRSISSEVITKLKKQADIFGNPRIIISDRGTGFTSHKFEQYCKEEEIHHILTTTGVPRSNGQVERVNRTIIPLLTKLSAPNSSEWYKYLEICQKYLNATPHRNIAMTPFTLFFSVNIRMREDLEIRELIEKEWIKMFEENRKELRVEDITYNRNRKETTGFKENNLVAIKRTQRSWIEASTYIFWTLSNYESITERSIFREEDRRG